MIIPVWVMCFISKRNKYFNETPKLEMKSFSKSNELKITELFLLIELTSFVAKKIHFDVWKDCRMRPYCLLLKYLVY